MTEEILGGFELMKQHILSEYYSIFPAYCHGAKEEMNDIEIEGG